MRKRFLSIFLTLCMVLAFTPLTAQATEPGEEANTEEGTLEAAVMPLATESAHTHCICGKTDCSGDGHDASQTWTATDTLPTQAGYYYLTANVELTSTWSPANNTVLCLNGNSITYNISEGFVSCIEVQRGVSFTLTDCNSNEPGIIVGTGRGKYIDGVYNNGTFTISGNPSINTNTQGGAANNVYLCTGKTITIDNPLTSGASIGVTVGTAPTSGNPVDIATGGLQEYVNYFSSDNSDYEISNDNGTLKLKVKNSDPVTPPCYTSGSLRLRCQPYECW